VTDVDMTVDELMDYAKRFNEIMDSRSSDDIKDQRLANLMSDLERAYHIPFLRDEDFEKKHPRLMAFYRSVSYARKLD